MVAMGGRPQPSATVSNSILNLLNNIVGAGLFSMPWCLSQSSLLSGCGLFVLICFLNYSAFMLLAKCCEKTGLFSYLEIGKTAFGDSFGLTAQLVIILMATGSLISFIVLAGDCLIGSKTGVLLIWLGKDTFLGGGSEAARAVVLFVFSGLILLPLCLPRTIDALRFAAYLGFAATVFAGFLCVYELAAEPANSLTDDEASMGPAKLESTVNWFGLPLTMFEAIPIVNVAFTAHYNGPRFYYELADRSIDKFSKVVGGALGFALCLYIVVGVTGYLSFGMDTVGDVLKNFNSSYRFAIGARFALLVIILGVFPKAHHPVRDGIIRLTSGGLHDTDTLPFPQLALLTTAIVSFAAIVGVVCTQIEVVLAYKGAIFGTLTVYIFPALMMAALNYESQESNTKYSKLATSTLSTPPIANSARDDDEESHSSDGSIGPVVSDWNDFLISLFKLKENRLPAFILVWGTTTGVIAVAVTIAKQAGLL